MGPAESKRVPPRCEFEMDKLILQMDQVLPSDVQLIDEVVVKIMALVEGTGCTQDLEGVDLALREALANAILHGNRSDPAKAVRVCAAVQEDCGILVTRQGRRIGIRSRPGRESFGRSEPAGGPRQGDLFGQPVHG